MSAEGQVWAVPVGDLGYCPAVVARGSGAEPGVDFAFVYVRPDPSPEPLRASSVPSLSEWGQAWIGLVASRPFKNGRWLDCGHLPTFSREAWPVPPTRESLFSERSFRGEPLETWPDNRWAIATTRDEATMTLIANDGSPAEEAMRFPVCDVVTAPSAFEKALIKHLHGSKVMFHDMLLSFNEVSQDRVRTWAKHGERVRSRPGVREPEALPAGRTTDRGLTAGAWLALPLAGGGFGAAMLLAKPLAHDRVFSDAVVLGFGCRWTMWPTLAQVRNLTPESGVYIAQTSMICVRDGRWRVLGVEEPFDPDRWVLPRRWTQTREQVGTDQIEVPLSADQVAVIGMDKALIAADPLAGRRWRSGHNYAGIERTIPQILDGTYVERAPLGDIPMAADGVVTPERLRAWRKMNRHIAKALAE